MDAQDKRWGRCSQSKKVEMGTLYLNSFKTIDDPQRNQKEKEEADQMIDELIVLYGKENLDAFANQYVTDTYLESKGFECNRNRDERFNRDREFELHQNGILIKLKRKKAEDTYRVEIYHENTEKSSFTGYRPLNIDDNIRNICTKNELAHALQKAGAILGENFKRLRDIYVRDINTLNSIIQAI